MSDASDQGTQAADPGRDASIDPALLQSVHQQLLREQNLPFGVLAGLAASLLGAAAWAVITFATGYQIGFMAIGIGFLVGFAVRLAGKGLSAVFGAAGALLSLLGCALGNLLAVTALVADAEGVRFVDALAQLTPELAQKLMVSFFGPMDLVFYAIAAYEGYQLSFRRLGAQELEQRLGRVGG